METWTGESVLSVQEKENAASAIDYISRLGLDTVYHNQYIHIQIAVHLIGKTYMYFAEGQSSGFTDVFHCIQ